MIPKSASVVIVGGGVMGVSVAFHLAEAGVAGVLLVERGELGSGSTGSAVGGIGAQFSGAARIALGRRSLAAYERFRERPGGAIDLHRVGQLFLLSRQADVQAYRAAVALQNELGVPSRMLEPAEASMLAPIVRRKGVLAAAFHAGDGHCSPDAVVAGYAAAARRLGVTIATGVEVTGIEVTGIEVTGIGRPGSVRSRSITEVVTSAGTVCTDAVICCAGAWSSRIGELAGVRLPVSPMRRQTLATEPLTDFLAGLAPSTMPMTTDVASTLQLYREGPGIGVGLAYSRERTGWSTEVSEEWLPELTEAIERRAPRLFTIGVAAARAGLHEVTPDREPLIGEASGVSRFLYATGFSGHGVAQAPAVGEVIRDLYLGREPVVDVRSLSADRFEPRLRSKARPEPPPRDAVLERDPLWSDIGVRG